MKLTVLRIGKVDAEIVEQVLHGLNQAFPEAICTLAEDVLPVPGKAYNQERNQVYSTYVLTKMVSHVEKRDVDRVLGVTELDLYVPGLNSVFGEARCPGNVALISDFRLNPEFYGESPNKQLFYERAVKEAVHEVGHTLGLLHCRNSSCIMFFSNSILDTDGKKSTFCEKCSAVVAEIFRKRGF
jgi:archaemetzincin